MKTHSKGPGDGFSFYGSRWKTVLAVLGFLLLLTTSIASDGYFLWLYVSRDSLTILWRRKPIFSAPIPYLQGPRIPLWIPLASLLILLSYIIIVGRGLSIRVSFLRRRLHHYQIGFLSVGFSTILMVPLFLPGFQDSPLWIASKRTSLLEVLEGLSFIFFISGVSLILTDARDFLSCVKTWLKLGREGKSTKNML